MMFSLLLFITQLDFISSCSVNQTNSLYMVYPVIGQNYVLNLDEYFSGNQLQYTTDSTYPIRQQVTYNDIDATNFPATSSIIATASNQNWVTATLGESIAVLLFDSGNYYVYVGSIGLNNKTPISWTQLAQPISNYSSVNCSSLLFLSNEDVVVSCVQQSINQQLLYYFEQGSTQDVMPLLFQTQIIIDQNALYVQMQAINLAYYQWQIYITYTDYFLKNSTIYSYNVTSKDPKVSLNPLAFTHNGQIPFTQELLGSYIVNEYAAIIAFNNSVIIYDLGNKSHSKISEISLLGMGAFPLGNDYNSFQIIVTLLCANGLQNIYIAQQLSGQYEVLYSTYIQFPKSYTPSISAQLLASPEFVVVQDPDQQVVYVYPGWLNSNSNQNYIWTQTYTNQLGLIFNSYTQDIYLFGLNGQALIHLGAAYMLINIPAGSTTGNQTITVTANNECSINLAITPVSGQELNSQIYYSTAGLQAQNGPQITILANQNYTTNLNSLFVGANLTYGGTATPESQSKFNITQSIQKSLNVKDGDILFSQILPINYKITNIQFEYLYTLQLSKKNSTLYVYFCTEFTCSVESALFVDSQVLGVAISNNLNSWQNQFYLAIYQSNSTESVSVYNIKGQMITGKPVKIIVVNNTVPTMTVSSIKIVSNNLYIITTVPQSLQVVNLYNLSDIQVYQGYDVVPRQIYSSPLYPNLIFLDNTYELQIFRIPNDFQDLKSYLVQTLPYQLQKGSTVGVGILFNGIYIAESDGTNQALTLYPTQALDSFLTTPLTKLAISIPLSTYNITIQNPVVSAFSSSHFYLSIIASDLTNQLAVFQYTGEQLNVLYFSQYLSSALSQISLATVIYRYKQSYDVLCNQQNVSVDFYQITNNTIGYFIPDIEQKNDVQNYSIVYTANTTDNQSLDTQIYLRVAISGKYITPTPTPYAKNIPDQQYTFFGRLMVNPANLFTGYIQTYKTGFQTNSIFIMQNQSEVIQPMTNSSANLTNVDIVTTATSSYNYAYIMNSTMGIYQYQNIPGQHNYYSLYQMDNTTFTSCPFMFMYNPDLLVIVCTNANDSYLVYNNNSTNTSFANLVGSAQPNLTSAQYNYSQSVFAFENNFTNSTNQVFQLSVIQLTYNGSQFKQFESGSIIKTFKYQPINYGLFATLNSSQNVYSFGLSVITNSSFPVVKLYAIEQNQTTYALNVSRSYTVTFPPIENKLDFISIQMYGVGTYNQTSFDLINMTFVLQTKSIGYAYEFVTNPTLNALNRTIDLQATLKYKLMPLDQIQASQMLIQNNSIVTVYQNSTYRSIVGVFTFPDEGQPNTELYPISYQEFNNCTLSNFTLSSNGTLFFQINKAVNQFYIQPNLIITTNLIALKQHQNLIDEAETQGISLILMAQNQNLSATIGIKGSLVTPDGDSYIKIHHGLHIGLGVFFFCIVTGVLIYLGINSLKKAEDQDYNGRQEVEM